MNHRAGVAVEVANKIVNHKVSDDLFNIDRTAYVLVIVQLFERCNQPILIGIGYIRLSIIKDILIA